MRLVMMGTGTFAEPTFQAILGGPHAVVGLVTQPDRGVIHERGSTRQTGLGMKAIASSHAVPVLQPERINTPEGVAGLRALAPDLLVVAAYGQILSKDVLSVPTQGGINVHASLLPRYRGAAPVAWAIAHGETRTGVTIIKMSVHLDAGQMLAQEVVEIGPDETAGELEARLAQVGSRLAVRVIDQIAAGTAQGIPQDASLATKAPKLTKAHGQIDWQRPAAAICNHIRAMQPWPTAYTFWHHAGKPPLRLQILRARPCETPMPSGNSPGVVVPLPDESSRMVVGAGSGECVEILDLQPAGKRRMTAAEFLRGHHPQPGDQLGPESL